MNEVSSIEDFNIAKYLLRTWLPGNKSSDNLKKLMLDFLDIIEQERERLIDHCDAQQAEQRQIEMALCHTEDAISITNAEGTIRMVNPSFEKLTGYMGHEIVGNNHDEFWQETEPAIMKAMKSTINSGNDWQGKLSLQSREGKLCDVQASIVPIIQPDGIITHYVYTLHNITEQLKLERRLSRQTRFLEKVINLNPSAIIILNEKGTWLLDNLAAKTLISDFGSEGRTELSRLFLSKLRHKKGTESQKLEITMPNRSTRSFLLFSEEIPVRYLIPESEEGVAFLITLSDITANEAKNREILLRQKALLASRIEKNLIQGEFINSFIYQLQQPLNVSKAAISRVQTALDQNRYEQIRQAIPLMKEQLEHLEDELIRYRTLPGKYPKDTETTTKDTELSEAIQVLFQDKYLTGDLEISLNPEQTVEYPLPYEIMQLLIKILIDNAFEAMDSADKNSKIKITFKKGKDVPILVVEDNGQGITTGDRYKVFEPFYTNKEDHAGLSLTILHQLVNNIRGSVDISESKLGGAKITLLFPWSAHE